MAKKKQQEKQPTAAEIEAARKRIEIDDLRGEHRRWLLLSDLGDQFAEHRHYQDGGLAAIVKFLVELHHWRPSDVRALPVDDLWLCMDGHSPNPDPDAHKGVDD